MAVVVLVTFLSRQKGLVDVVMLPTVVLAVAFLLQALRPLLAQIGRGFLRTVPRLTRRLVVVMVPPILRVLVPPHAGYLTCAVLQRWDGQLRLAHGV